MERNAVYNLLNYRNRLQRIFSHALTWLLYFSFIIIYQWIVSLKPDILPIIKGDLPFFVIDIIFTYTVLFYIDTFLFRKKYLLFIAVTIATIILELFVYQVVPNSINVIFRDERIFDLLDFNAVKDISYVLYSVCFPISMFSILHIARNWILTQAKMSEIESENLKNELNLLKTQLNQHFLFNTLNNIDSLIYYDPDKASRTVISLSGLLRYTLYETNQERVPMFQELEYIKEYLDVFSVRMTPEDRIEFITEGDYSKITVAPMLFIPFIENAIKYCDRNRPKCIKIRFTFRNPMVEFEVFNWKKITGQVSNEGLGITNAKRRMHLLYPGKHTLSIKEDETEYDVHLMLETG